MRQNRPFSSTFLGIIALLTILVSCQRVVKNEVYFEHLARYVYAYTDGSVGRMEPIRVRFVNPAVAPAQVGQKVARRIFNLEPAVEGDAVWEDERTILLKPTQKMPYGQEYHGKVRLRNIYSESPVSDFDFDFRVQDLKVKVELEGLTTASEDGKLQQASGRITTNDVVDHATLEKILTARQGGENLPITWSHTDNNQLHTFTVQQIKRSNLRSRVELSWDAKALGSADKGSERLNVPALDEFYPLSAKVEQGKGEQLVLINFSDPLRSDQVFDGLVQVEGVQKGLRYAVQGNHLRVYLPERIGGSRQVSIHAGLVNSASARLQQDSRWGLAFEAVQPQVRLLGRGAIIPDSDDGRVLFPFEAMGLEAVDVEIFKIYNNNVLQFLQVNDLEGSNELSRVGRIIHQQKIDLRTLNPNANTQTWQRYAFDLKDMIRKDPGAIYQVRIVFRRSYATNLACAQVNNDSEAGQLGGPNANAADNSGNDGPAVGRKDEYGNFHTLWGSYRGFYWPAASEMDGDVSYNGYDYDDYDYESDSYEYDNRENACFREYYNQDQFVKRNAFVSNLGLTAKSGPDHAIFAAVTDLRTAKPVGGAELEFFNYQLQSIGKATTNGEGVVMLEQLNGKPFLMVAQKGGQRGYLRMPNGAALSLSQFDVAGVQSQRGMKGYLYGERGVWRPGDSIYLNFVLEDYTGKLPPNHPVNFTVTDVKGATRYQTVSTQPVNGVYAFHFATDPEAPTGTWMAQVEVGGASFTQSLKVETVKPNRLKLDFNFGKKYLDATEGQSAQLTVNWLHGAPGRGLKALVEMQLVKSSANFPRFKDFVFEDPTRNVQSDEQKLFDGNLNEQGKATVPLNLNLGNFAPGKLQARFKLRATEPGGDFSIDNESVEVYPYQRMAGIKIPLNRWGGKQLDYNETGTVELACVDVNGQPVANRQLEVGLYRVDWRWWWEMDNYHYDLQQYNSSEHINAVATTTLTTDANGRVNWRVTPTQWGRYMVRVIEPESGHAAGDFFWSGYPDRMDDQNARNALAMLPLAADKTNYMAGEEVVIKVPASESGRILLTLENGTRVLKHLWFDAKAGDNLIKFKTETNMAPSIYAHVSLIQPHAQTLNDLPIRMYGVVALNIENPSTKLNPKIEMADVLKPNETFTVKVAEQSGKACAYTLAIVDEGLLDLTSFKTPNPWDIFFAREALGVRTWDVFDYVLGAYAIDAGRIFGIGGDEFNRKAKKNSSVNRFKPAVIHVGPFYLKKGETATHRLTMPNYVGSVRVMAVMSAPAPAGQSAYGSAEKTCPVRKPLMLLPTLPRVIGPGETLKMPVNVFAMEKQVREATIKVRESSGLVTLAGNSTATLTFSEIGDKMAYFDLKVGNKTGAAKFIVEGVGGGENSREEIDIEVRNPMPYSTNSWDATIEPGKEAVIPVDASAFANLDNYTLEVSALPPINLNRSMEYLIRYPHGCLEQTTSAAFPQLYVDALMPLSDKMQADVSKNIAKAIKKIQNQQNFDGGFTYWPGSYYNDWSSTYAGHFLLEARKKGYVVPDEVVNKWLNYQANMARQWAMQSGVPEWGIHDNQLGQAYRLYTLALAGQASIADMNRLREVKDLYAEAGALLASAYGAAGKPEVIRELLSRNWKSNFVYEWCGYTYGSDIRDRALLLEAYVSGGDNSRAAAMLDYIAREMGKSDYYFYNTQGIATVLRAMHRYAVSSGTSGPNFAYQFNTGTLQKGNLTTPIASVDVTAEGSTARQITLKNNDSKRLYARFIAKGQLNPTVNQPATNSNIAMKVRFLNAAGVEINPASLKQGTDFVAEVTVNRQTNFGFYFNELSLTQVFPSGWEIMNARLSNFQENTTVSTVRPNYQDIRDDRVMSYFGLGNFDNGRSIVLRLQLNAAYPGRFFMPGVVCESMYDSRIRASTGGMWVSVD
jgi:alpha-2-macroglobulin